MNNTLKYTLIGTAGVAVLALAWWQRRAILYPLFKANQWAYFKQLHPKYRPVFEKFVERCEKAGYDIMFTSLIRKTDYDSYHHFGLAVDVNALDVSKNKKIKMASSDAEWKPIVNIAKKLDLRWGGDFHKSDGTAYHDRVHFDVGKLVGKSPSELLAMAKEQKVEPNKVKIT